MADSQAIATWICQLEDDPRHPGVAKDLGDGAGITRYGITSKWHSADVPADFFTTMLPAVAHLVAIAFYKNKFCMPLSVDQMDSEVMAAALVSFAVNDNMHTAVRILQQVLGVNSDGNFGPVTLAAANAHNSNYFDQAFRIAWQQFYRDAAAKNPGDAQWIGGWLRRAALVYPATL